MDLILFILFVAVTYIIGTRVEKSHYRFIELRERVLLDLPVVTGKNFLDIDKNIESSDLVTGSVVISIDYFKRILASLRNLVGGEVGAYETLLDRGRREAILRMKRSGARSDIIVNMRIETSMIGQSADKRKSLGSIEVLAYGTAIKYKK